MTLRPLTQAPVLRDQVYAALEELIINRSLAPGERLLEAELAEQLQVSRNPVREALTILAHAGWVDLRPRHGAVVHTPTPKEIEDFFQIRRVLEEEGARLAAKKAADADVRELRRLWEKGLVAVEAGDAAATARANSTFHDYVSQLADNRVLDEVLGLMKKRLRWYFAPVARLRGRASWDEHAELVDALAAKDGERAAGVMRAHSDATATLYRDLYEQAKSDSA
jgi:DNA-binding GntR family transcriptional regulator